MVLGAHTWRLDRITLDPAPDARDRDDVQWFATKVDGFWGTPGTDAGTAPKAVSYGSYRSPAYLKGRTISLTGRAYAPDWTALEHCYATVSALCPDPERIYDLVCGSPLGDLRCGVALDGEILVAPLEITEPGIEFSLQMFAPDPRKYRVAVNTVSTTLTGGQSGGALWNGPDGTTGALWNGTDGASGMLWQVGATSAGRMSLTNDGTAPTPITFTVSGPAINPSIVDLTGGHTISYGGEVPRGSQLVIHTGTGAVQLDGINQGARLDAAEFFTIPGRTSIDVAYRPAPSSPSSTSLTASWSDAYL